MKKKQINRAIKIVIHQIIKETVPRFHPKAIILVGSFGRDEPTVIIKKNKIIFLSDCEMSFVPNSYISKKSLEELKLVLSKKTGLDITVSRNISLLLYSTLPLPQSISKRIWKPTIQRYDAKYGSKVIYGDNYLHWAPEIKPEDIPLWEGIRLIFNRVAEALKYFSINGISPQEEPKLAYWTSKILIACQDALLLSIRKYHPSYRARNKIFQTAFALHFHELKEEIPELLPLTTKATNYKLNPKNNIYNKTITELWFDTQKICDKVFRYVIKKDMRITFNTYSEFQEKYLKHPKIKHEYYNGLFSSPIYRNLMTSFRSHKYLSLKLIKRFRTPWKHIIYSSIPLSYFSLSRNGYVDRSQLKYLRDTILLFRKLRPESDDDYKEWEYLKNQLVNLWYDICY